MSRINRVAALVSLLGVLGAEVAPLRAQSDTSDGGARSPHFLVALATPDRPVRATPAQVPILRRRLSLALEGVTIGDALAEIARQSGLHIMYSDAVIPPRRKIHLKADDITVAAALTEVLLDADVDVVFEKGQRAMLVRRGESSYRLAGPRGTVVGKVTDSASGRGLPAADVSLGGTRWRVQTDSVGQYRLADVDSGGYTLVVRRPGYAKRTQQVVVGNRVEDTVNVVLSPRAARLDELVTTATGRRRRMDIANDVTTINADSVMQVAPIRSVTDLLDGRVPGLTVQRTSGAPGDPARLRLRGAASALRNNDPIVVVDGIRIYAEQSAARNANLANFPNLGTRTPDSTSATRYAAPSPLDYIDPNTIETIEVLKGPSAATLYGQDAANGVIVITTKRGRAGPTRWTASAVQGRTQLAGSFPKLFFRSGVSLYHADQVVDCPATNIGFLETGTEAEPCQGDTVHSFQLLNDPALTVLSHGRRTSLSLGASGGTQTLTYTVSGMYDDNTGLPKLPSYEVDRYHTQFGVAPPDWMERPQHFTQWGVTSQLAARLSAKADLTFKMELSRTNQQRSSLEQQLGTLMATYVDPATGTYYQSTNRPVENTNDGPQMPVIPVLGAMQGYYERATDVATRVTNGAALSWRPKTWLTFNADAGIDVQQRADQLFFPRGPINYRYGGNTIYLGGGDTTGYVNNGQGNTLVSTVNLRSNAVAPLGRGLTFRFASGVNYTGTKTKDLSGGTSSLPSGTSLNGDSIRFVLPAQTSNATFGWYAEPSVGSNKFSINAGLRLDGGSAYGSGLSGVHLPKFPKMGFTYLLSDEPWFPLKSVVQTFRLRVAYGRASRQPGPQDRLRLYTAPASVLADSQSTVGVLVQTLGNTKVRPERTAEFEGGFDADLLDSRLSLTVSGYRKTTDDALLNVPVAPSVLGGGALSVIENIGVTRNTGLELTAALQLIRSAALTWTGQAIFSQRRDVVVKLGQGVQPFYTDPEFGYLGGLRVAAGYPLNGRWTRPILGYADANGDGVLEATEVQLGDTAVYVGSSLPNYQADFSTSVSLWRGAVVLDAHVDYQDGLSQRNTVAQQLAVFSRGAQVPGTPLDQQISTMLLSQPSGTSDYNWIQTVNTLRFNSFSVRYMVPVTLARRLGAQTLSVALQGDNLGLWTNYRGLDPNVNAFSTGNAVTDTGILPMPRTWQLRVNATY